MATLFPAGRQVMELSSKVVDIPPHVASGSLKIGCDQTFRCPSGDTACADSEHLGGFRGVNELFWHARQYRGWGGWIAASSLDWRACLD
jgi:hypothetical protein